MVNEIQYTSIKEILADLTEHPLLKDLTLEQVVRHTLRFIAKHGHPQLYQDKLAEVEIKDFRGTLPCDLVRIIQVMDRASGACLRSMTDTFNQGMVAKRKSAEKKETPKHPELYIPKDTQYIDEPAFKTNNRIIYTSFPEGCVGISYKAIPVDEDGLPMIIDDEIYKDALETYIKEKVFTVKFEMGDLPAAILSNVKQEAAWASGKLAAAMKIPSLSEMETLTRAWSSLLINARHFDNGFREFGNREYLRKH